MDKDRDSYINHNRQYESGGQLEHETKVHNEKNSDNFKFVYQDDIPHGRTLDIHKDIKVGVDIGAGTGWFAHYLVNERSFKKVFAVEPSEAAIDIAKKINPTKKRAVKYVNGFAEEEIAKLKLDEPTFFSTMCVFAHLTDNVVESTLKAIDSVAPVGSVLACSEPWGDVYHRHCWHIRPPEWWSELMPEWEFEFYQDAQLNDPPRRFKGFIAIRT